MTPEEQVYWGQAIQYSRVDFGHSKNCEETKKRIFDAVMCTLGDKNKCTLTFQETEKIVYDMQNEGSKKNKRMPKLEENQNNLPKLEESQNNLMYKQEKAILIL